MYFGVLATALSVIALGVTAVVQASAGLSEGTARDKTLLELQIESSREIRRALATPVSQPPRLPPITARPARDLREAAASQIRKPAQMKLPQEAMNAMAMRTAKLSSSDLVVVCRPRPPCGLLIAETFEKEKAPACRGFLLSNTP
jgi:hypothetical protein